MTDTKDRILAITVMIPLVLTGAFVIISVLGRMAEGIGEHVEQRERCLKQATNGLEIERCR